MILRSGSRLGLCVLVAACGGGSTAVSAGGESSAATTTTAGGGGETTAANGDSGAGSATDALGATPWNEAVVDHRRELCERMAAIAGPPVERECPNGLSETRGRDPASCADEHVRLGVARTCTILVSEVEACQRAMTTIEWCLGVEIIDRVMSLPECAGLNACSRAATPAPDAPSDAPASG